MWEYNLNSEKLFLQINRGSEINVVKRITISIINIVPVHVQLQQSPPQ